jgi:hypothetical protein
MAAMLVVGLAAAEEKPLAKPTATSIYTKWERGPSALGGAFPIAVWVQAPKNAKRYRDAGINVYVGLWRGPTEEHLAELKAAGMHVICSQRQVALDSANADVIIGWMHGDEPDNAQSRRGGGGYDPPILPSKIIADYERIRERDPSRPVLLNLGQGVAFDQYIGRGTRRNHPEDYAEYVKGCDIASFDIYPAVHDHADVAGKLEFVPQGVERLRRWSNDEKIIWNCIECSRISNTKTKPTPHQIRAEVWMSLIHGSRGLIYFVHQFEPNFKEASLLDDDELLPAITALNRQIQELAPILNSPSISDAAKVTSFNTDAPVAVMAKQHDGSLYLFTVCMRNAPTQASFELSGSLKDRKVSVVGENRSITLQGGQFKDAFEPYGVHLYRVD